MMMKQPVTLESAIGNIRRNISRLQAIAVKAPKKVARVRPRRPSKTLALCRAVVFAVQEAKKTGRLVKLHPNGYLIRWTEK